MAPEMSKKLALLDVSTAALLQQLGDNRQDINNLMTSFCNLGPDDARAILGALELEKKEMVCMAISDNTAVTYQGTAGLGSHWACLAYQRASNTFYLFDSMTGSSMVRTARSLLPVLSAVVGGAEAEFKVVPEMPQQQNGCDCGVYTIAVARLLCASIAAASWPSTEALAILTPEAVADTRCQVRAAIDSLS